MIQEQFVELERLPASTMLPLSVLHACARQLPVTLVRKDATGALCVHPALAAAHQRVLNTDFRQVHWHLESDRDVRATAAWCALGGSFLADFGADSARARIFAWGLNPVPAATHYAMAELKGRDSTRIPTAACTLTEAVIDFIDTEAMPLTVEMLTTLFQLGPAGIRAPANERVPDMFVHDGLVQFIVPGIASPYARLLGVFQRLTGQQLMGVSSANFSGKGRYWLHSGGTHKNLGELKSNMGFLGLPVLAGPVKLATNGRSPLSLEEKYVHLHDRFQKLDAQSRADCQVLLPTSVTIVQPVSNGRTWQIVRHGSLHQAVIVQALAPFDVEIVLASEERLEIGVY